MSENYLTTISMFMAGTIAAASLLYALHISSGSRKSEDSKSREPLDDEKDQTETAPNDNTIALIESKSVAISAKSSPSVTFKNMETENLLQLLLTISEEQARKEGYIHRGITCNNCGTSPIKGYRFKCANCVDFDICEMCEADDVHYKNHVFTKIRIPIPPLANPRSALLNIFYPGNFNVHENSEVSYEQLKSLQKTSHFDQWELQALYEQFKSLAASPEGIDQNTFEQCLGPLGTERNLITERIFRFFDQDGDDHISYSELVSGLSVLCKGSLEEKVLYAFKGYDLDNDGFVSRDELRKMFKAYFYLSMELVRDVVRSLEEEIIEHFDDADAKPVSAAFTAPIPPSNNNNANLYESIEQRSMIRSVESPSGESGLGHAGVMESMSQEAIEEMVDKTFNVIDTNKDGLISYEDFREFVKQDSTLIAWFEALGSVF